jgi:hypothetical protein
MPGAETYTATVALWIMLGLMVERLTFMFYFFLFTNT